MLLRFPGGKKRLRKHIVPVLQASFTAGLEYREPFLGSGSIGFSILTPKFYIPVDKIWINDVDKGMAALWNSVIENPEKLKSEIENFIPSVQAFYEFQDALINSPPTDQLQHGFQKLAIHQMSYSGLGTKAGGPIGGKAQKSEYAVDCRWSPRTLFKNIDQIHKSCKEVTFRHNKCTSFDFEQLIDDKKYKALLYLDPPYFVKGDDLYQHSFSEDDHQRLAKALKRTKHSWVLSYDDCPDIHELYKDWADIKKIALTYTIRGAHAKTELLITSRS